ncbi:MAG: phosphate ABC transporter substrate-binding protein PstS [Gammaproteobacteria bacterium]|nr:phosphate ABC transporter substrate-binding protein PstS [Gammaproteobacteria bacterium]
MKRLLMMVTAAILSTTSALAASDNGEITGAGSSFVYPAMVKWAKGYNDAKTIKVNYQSIGSGGGMRQLKAKTIDFAASDEPLTKDQLTQRGWKQYPIIMGGIIPIVNIHGIKNGQLILSGPVLADIYQGKLDYWDAKPIKALNPGLKLPHAMIIPVHRSDGSGTTYNFTYYLAQVSPAWKNKVNYSTNISWPAGLGGKGNPGVAALVQQLTNSIGYVEYAYITNDSKLTYVSMKNSSGTVVKPTIATFKAGIKAASQQPGPHNQMITNPPGTDSWPIMSTTFVMMPKWLAAEKAQEVKAFLAWCYRNGGDLAQALSYVPIPAERYQPIIANWKIS